MSASGGSAGRGSAGVGPRGAVADGAAKLVLGEPTHEGHDELVAGLLKNACETPPSQQAEQAPAEVTTGDSTTGRDTVCTTGVDSTGRKLVTGTTGRKTVCDETTGEKVVVGAKPAAVVGGTTVVVVVNGRKTSRVNWPRPPLPKRSCSSSLGPTGSAGAMTG